MRDVRSDISGNNGWTSVCDSCFRQNRESGGLSQCQRCWTRSRIRSRRCTGTCCKSPCKRTCQCITCQVLDPRDRGRISLGLGAGTGSAACERDQRDEGHDVACAGGGPTTGNRRPRSRRRTWIWIWKNKSTSRPRSLPCQGKACCGDRCRIDCLTEGCRDVRVDGHTGVRIDRVCGENRGWGGGVLRSTCCKGVKIAWLPTQLTVLPTTGGTKVNVAGVQVAGSIASVKLAVSLRLVGTPAVALTGFVELTVGGVGSNAGAAGPPPSTPPPPHPATKTAGRNAISPIVEILIAPSPFGSMS